jgi:hypothetical protein
MTDNTPISKSTKDSLIDSLMGKHGLSKSVFFTPGENDFKSIVLKSPIFRDGIEVPLYWLKPLYVISIFQASGDCFQGLKGALWNEAQDLFRVTKYPKWYNDELIVESYRLGRVALSVACGDRDTSTKGDNFWWLVGSDPLRLDIALSQSIGLDIHKNPTIEKLSNHFDCDMRVPSTPQIPQNLISYKYSRVQKLISITYNISKRIYYIGSSLQLGYQNRWRVPRYIKKKILRRA